MFTGAFFFVVMASAVAWFMHDAAAVHVTVEVDEAMSRFWAVQAVEANGM